MSSAVTQRLEASGTRRRRPKFFLIPFAPLVLLFFVAASIVTSVRAHLAYKKAAAEAAAALETRIEAAVEPVNLTASGFARRFFYRTPQPKHVLASAATIMAGVLVASALAGGTYALLNSQAQTSSVTVSSGSVAILVSANGSSPSTSVSIPSAAWSSMLPGDFASQSFTLSGGGTASYSLSFRLATMTPWDIRIVGGACPTTLLTIAPITTTPLGVGTYTPSLNTQLCIQASLPATAAAAVAGTTSNLSLIIDAVQVSP